jgi:hypothetical protein
MLHQPQQVFQRSPLCAYMGFQVTGSRAQQVLYAHGITPPFSAVSLAE